MKECGFLVRPMGVLAAIALAGMALSVRADVVMENARMRLVVGDDACARSLVLKATGEELLDVRDPLPLFSVTQPRPFNNEIKLAHPNARTTYAANRLRREGNRLVVGFDLAPYEALVDVNESDDYIVFTLRDFLLTEKSYPLCPTTTVPLDFTAPPVDVFRLVQLPIRNRANFGAWLNVQWDGKGAVGVFSTSPYALVGSESRNGCRVMYAQALREVKLKGAGAALVVDAGDAAILDRIDALERDFGLPRGVENRRNSLVNASIYFACGFTPQNVDRHIALAKKGGFRLMEISTGNFFGACGDYRLNKHFPNGMADVKRTLDKIHAAGITPGMHILHTFISPTSQLVAGGADRRLQLRETYTLARPLGADDTEAWVDENTMNAERSAKCRILKFGRELMTYEGFTTERPYRFYGLKRGHAGTPVSAHEEGLIGGTLWVCEYGGGEYYLKQDSDLQDEIADKVAEFWKAGMRFVYFDGSEGVCAPFAYHVPNAQYRMWKKFDPQPILGEGAAKAHFGWHMLSGANAFDVFFPEEFKQKIDEYPAAEAPMMKRDFTRVNFGWWGFWAPGDLIRGRKTMGVQPDMWEYGTAKAAAWDCPVSIQMNIERLERHPRLDDILEVMRRWEDVRAKKWLTPERKALIRQSDSGCHLYVNEKGAYELHEIEMLPTPPAAKDLRGFLFERNGRRVLAFWHMNGTGSVRMALDEKGDDGTYCASGLRYVETALSRTDAIRAFSRARMVSPTARTEQPYQFRARLECVHESCVRDRAARPEADDFVFRDGMTVGDADFADYLNVSMGVRVSAERGDAVSGTIDASLREREYVVDVRREGIAIRAADDRALHQAYYHLEDLMSLRRAPFVKIGSERRRARFSPRMIHSGYGCDVFPDAYLKRIAHHGFDAIVIYIKDVDKTAAGPNQDVNGLIERARKVGLDTYLYSSVSCFAHPDDPKGKAEIEASFGRIAKAHPGAKGMVFVGESCQFPSRDPRVQPVRYQDINHADPRPLAGWFPCRDYPDWLKAVMDVLHQHSPNMEIVFWTYNWSERDAQLCADLVKRFPDGVAIQGTLGNGAVTRHDNGLVCHCRDYTVSTPGFTDHYAAQARAAKSANRRFYTMSNTAGLTWDYGVAPYLPCPYQWKKRWEGLVDPQYGIAGLMETHHFGWYPSIVSELAKEAFTEGGLPFDEHIRKIAVRDFGETQADRVLQAWRKWSQTEVDYVANNENQYGPFRIGPAFPYNFGGRKILHAEFPQDKRAYHTMRWMAILNFPFDLEQAHEQNISFTELDDDYRQKQLELFRRMRTDFAEGVKILQEAAATLDGARRAKAEEMIRVGAWHQRTVETAINLNCGYLAHKRGDRAGVLRYARAEYANALAALELVERDSRLGWEPSMEYAAGPQQIRWKLGRMETLYGRDALRAEGTK